MGLRMYLGTLGMYLGTLGMYPEEAMSCDAEAVEKNS